MPFYDTHLHLFNSAHIPLYMTLQRAMKDNLSGLKGEGAGVLAALLGMVGQIDNLLEAKIKRKAMFLRYFDRTVADNIGIVVGEIAEALRDETALEKETAHAKETIVLTPLILDLEYHDEFKRLGDQVCDVLKGIACVEPPSTHELRVFPFIGLDLRRFKSSKTIVEEFDKLVNEVSGNRFESPKGKTATDIESGTCIGIKIYPLLDVNPADSTYRPLFVELAKRGIPVTTHCQPDGYSLGDKKGKVLESYAHPGSWREILLDPQASGLKINFAHFGGEGEVRKSVNWQSPDSGPGMESSSGNRFGGFNTGTWTYQIVELLRCFPNTYADISAFDFSDSHAKAALRWLLWPNNNELMIATGALAQHDATYALSDKLLWGSDYPMPLDEKNAPNYWTLWADCKKAIGATHDPKIDGKYGPDVPPTVPAAAAQQLLNKMVSDNAERFLFG